MNPDNIGTVYVLTNAAMNGLVKIGKTTRDDIRIRLDELYTTGVPVPFECAYAAKVSDVSEVEKAFHLAFGPYRINPKREFFGIEPEQAIALLKLMTVEDVTPSIQEEADKVDQGAEEATKILKSRRPNLNFVEMGIPIGSTIEFVGTEKAATVISEKQVSYEGNDYSLTKLTEQLRGYLSAPCPHWTFSGRLLSKIYSETYDTF